MSLMRLSFVVTCYKCQPMPTSEAPLLNNSTVLLTAKCCYSMQLFVIVVQERELRLLLHQNLKNVGCIPATFL